MHTLKHYFNDPLGDLSQSLLILLTFLNIITLVTSQSMQNIMKLRKSKYDRSQTMNIAEINVVAGPHISSEILY